MENILENIIDGKRMPVLFIGSGISKRYLKNYPSWDELLDRLREKIGITTTSYQATIQIIKKDNPGISRGKINQKIASYLEDKLLILIKNNEMKLDTLFNEQDIEDCTKGVSYFKKLAAKEFIDYELNDKNSEELELLKKISEKISMVYTTNYDNFLVESVFNDFDVYDSQNSYYFRNNYSYGEIYNLHGSVKNPNSIIINENDYENFDKNLKIVTAKLLNSFLDFPVIFLGYSLEDDNIKNIMADFVNSFDDDIINQIKKNILFVEYREGETKLIQGEKQFSDSKGRSITLSTIITDNFSEIYKHIDKLKPTASSLEIKRYRATITKLLNETVVGSKKVFVEDINDADDHDIAIYIGKEEDIRKISNVGYRSIKNTDLMKKILEDDYNGLNWKDLADIWYESNNISKSNYTPIFFIKHMGNIDINHTSKRFKENYETMCKTFEEYEFKEVGDDEITENKIQSIMSKDIALSSKAYSIGKLLINALHYDKITCDYCLTFLKDLINQDEKYLLKSDIKKLLCYAWYKKYELHE